MTVFIPSPRILQTFVCVKGFTYAEKKLHYRWWFLFPAILNSNFVNWKLSHALALNEHLSPSYSWGKDFKQKLYVFLVSKKSKKYRLSKISCSITAWKVSKYGAFPGPHFPAFALNSERYSVSLCIQSECRKIRARKNSVFGHFSRSACLCSSSTEILNIPYQSIYFTDGFTLAFHTFMTNGNKRLYTLTQPAVERCRFV